MHVTDLHRRSVEGFAARVETLDGLSPERWAAPTPCAEWDVRALLNHIVYEDLWTVPLMEGATIEEVGDRYEGDLLGDDPLTATRAACDMAVTAAASGIVRERSSSVAARAATICNRRVTASGSAIGRLSTTASSPSVRPRASSSDTPA